jgi:hypothetical protein
LGLLAELSKAAAPEAPHLPHDHRPAGIIDRFIAKTNHQPTPLQKVVHFNAIIAAIQLK